MRSIQNASKNIFFSQNYIYYGDNFIQRATIGADLEWQFNYDDLQKNGGIQVEAELVMKKNIETRAEFNYQFNNEFEGFNPKNLNGFGWFIGYNPSEIVRLRLAFGMGDQIGYNLENLAVGDELNFRTFNLILPILADT